MRSAVSIHRFCVVIIIIVVRIIKHSPIAEYHVSNQKKRIIPSTAPINYAMCLDETQFLNTNRIVYIYHG